MKDLLNCPNCGAPIQNDICPYCGSVFLDWAAFDTNRPTFVKIKDWFGHYKLFKLGIDNVSEHFDAYPTYLYGDNSVYASIAQPEYTIEAEFRALPFKNALTNEEVLCIDIDPEKVEDEVIKKLINIGERNN